MSESLKQARRRRGAQDQAVRDGVRPEHPMFDKYVDYLLNLRTTRLRFAAEDFSEAMRQAAKPVAAKMMAAIKAAQR